MNDIADFETKTDERRARHRDREANSQPPKPTRYSTHLNTKKVDSTGGSNEDHNTLGTNRSRLENTIEETPSQKKARIRGSIFKDILNRSSERGQSKRTMVDKIKI